MVHLQGQQACLLPPALGRLSGLVIGNTRWQHPAMLSLLGYLLLDHAPLLDGKVLTKT